MVTMAKGSDLLSEDSPARIRQAPALARPRIGVSQGVRFGRSHFRLLRWLGGRATGYVPRSRLLCPHGSLSHGGSRRPRLPHLDAMDRSGSPSPRRSSDRDGAPSSGKSFPVAGMSERSSSAHSIAGSVCARVRACAPRPVLRSQSRGMSVPIVQIPEDRRWRLALKGSQTAPPAP
jgi:hypothetical protein